MKEVSKKIIKNPWIKFGIFPLMLLLVGSILSFHYILQNSNGLFVLYDYLTKEQMPNYSKNYLYKGSKISTYFTSRRNNLGIVSIRFNTISYLPAKQEDVLLFRIKEHGSTNWYFQHQFRSDFVAGMPFFPFGFPIITDSKNKTYNLEIVSLKGNKKNAVSLSASDPVLTLTYKIPKEQLLMNKKNLLLFIPEKIVNALEVQDTAMVILANFLPFLFYILYLLNIKKYTIVPAIKYLDKSLQENGKGPVKSIPYILLSWVKYALTDYFYFSVMLIILLDILLLHDINEILYWFLFFLWVFTFNSYKNKDKIALYAALSFLALSSIFIFVHLELIAQKLAIWSYIFLLICISRMLIKCIYKPYTTRKQ